MEKDYRLVDWAVAKARELYHDGVAVILSHDSYRLPEDKHIRFASHIIADGDVGGELARTVIIDGRGYDFFVQSWESYERDAEGKGYFSAKLLDAEVAYCRSEEDRRRFMALRQRLRSHLADSGYMYDRGLEWIGEAMELYRSMLFESELRSVRKAAAYIADFLSVALACLNQTCFRENSRLPELRAMRLMPEGFCDKYESLMRLRTVAELNALCHELICDVRTLFAGQRRCGAEDHSPDYDGLARWYQECAYYFRRIYADCAAGDAWLAFLELGWLQADIDDLAGQFGLKEADMLTGFDADDLAAAAAQARRVEEGILRAIDDGGARLDRYESIADFVRHNS